MSEPRSTGLRDFVLVYDGKCRLCQRSVEWIRRRHGDGSPEFMRARDPDVLDRFPGASPEALLEEMHLFGPSGRALTGSAAVEAILRRTRGWRWLGRLMGWPWIRPLARRVYRWVADHRTALGCGDHCSLSEPKGTGSSEPSPPPSPASRGRREGP